MIGVGAIVAFAVVVLGAVMPHLMDLSEKIAAAVKGVDPGEARPFAVVGYHEDSLVFLRRGRLDRINPDQVRAWISDHPDGLVATPIPVHGWYEKWDLSRLSGVQGFNVTWSPDPLGTQVLILGAGHE